jgi:hypothetical protein
MREGCQVLRNWGQIPIVLRNVLIFVGAHSVRDGLPGRVPRPSPTGWAPTGRGRPRGGLLRGGIAHGVGSYKGASPASAQFFDEFVGDAGRIGGYVFLSVHADA